MTRPRPILKSGAFPRHDTSSPLPFAACQGLASPHVHFPPTPRISSMHPVYSPQTYDRAPIAISPNVCQLPSRGSRKFRSPPTHFDIERRGRGRSRSRSQIDSSTEEEEEEEEEEDIKGSYFHPRAYEACKPESSSDMPQASITFEIASQPSLLADLSPSDESDDSIVTPPDRDSPAMLTSSSRPHTLHTPHRKSSWDSDAQGSTSYSAYSCAVSLCETQKHRPHLERSSVRRLGKPVKPFRASLDEGCLGGF